MELSLYRKYRPQTFAEVAGQDHVSRTLQNAVRSGTVAHAYVFAGSRGTGKTSMAKILAKALDCTGPDADGNPVTAPTVTPCGHCESCRAIAASTALDVIEMDAASNRGIDDIRELRDKVAFAPVQGRYKVYIIDEVHMLTKEAFNALLKTLEEPPPHVVFVLATTEPHKIPATILSRCQRFDFRRPRVHDIALVLGHIAASEGIEIDEPAILEIARHAEGGFRDAIGTLEKLATFFGDAPITSREVLDVLGVIASELLFEIVDVVIERDPAGALLFVQRLAERGTSYQQFIHDLLRHLRQVFLVQYLDDVSDDAATLQALSQNLEIDEQLLDRLLQQAHQLSGRELLRMVDLLGTAQTEIRNGLDPRLQLEMALVRAARPEVDHSADALEERLRRLESGSVPVAAPARSAARPEPPRPAPTKQPSAGHTPPGGATAQSTTTGAAPAQSAPPPAATAPRTAAVATDAAPAPSPTVPAPDPSPSAAKGENPDATVAELSTTDDQAAATTQADDGHPAAERTGDSSGSAGQVKRAWQLVLQQAEAQNVALYAAIREAHVRADGARLVLALPSALVLGKATQPDNRQLLAAIIERVTGETTTLEFVLDREAGAPAAAAPAAAVPDAGLTTAERIALVRRELEATDLPDDV